MLNRAVGAAAAAALLVVAVGCAGEEANIRYDGPLATTTLPRRTSTTTLTSEQTAKLTWTDATGNLAGMLSECGNVSWVAGRPGSADVIAGIARQGLWVNTGGAEWAQLNAGVSNRMTSIAFDPQDPARFWESGIYSPEGVYRTTDGGFTVTGLGLGHVDSVSVDFTDPDRRVLMAGLHEVTGGVRRSDDGGATWRSLNLGEVGFAGQVLVVNSQVALVGVTSDPNAGIYLTADGGTRWTQVNAGAVIGPGLLTRDGQIFWVLADGSLVRSDDLGQTFEEVSPPGTLSSSNVLELPDGRLAALSSEVAMTSEDLGETWDAVGEPFAMADPWGIAYSEVQNAFFAFYFTCGQDDANSVPAGSIERLDLSPPTSPAVTATPTAPT